MKWVRSSRRHLPAKVPIRLASLGHTNVAEDEADPSNVTRRTPSVKECRYWLAALIVLAVATRIWLFAGYEPGAEPDTGTYLSAARDLLAGDLSRSEGRRTPGYPLFIALVGEAPRRIVLAQMALGIGTSVLLFLMAMRMTGRPGVAFAAGLSYDFNLQQLFLEAALLTEPLTTFLVASTVLVLLTTMRRLRRREGAWVLALATGICGAAAIMVRPQFLFFLILLPPLVLCAASGLRWPSRRAWLHSVVLALPMLLAVLGWAKVVQSRTGYFAMSTQSGFGLVNHSVEFIELAPERYATVRDILLKYRAQRIAAAGHAGNTIWYAWPEIQEATGWSLPEASRQLQQMSMQMFAQHPLRYAQSVAQAWLQFWTVPIIWTPERISPAWLAQPLQAVWWIEHKLLRLCNLVFVVVVAAVVLSRRVRDSLRWDLDVTAISAVILASSLLQAMADRGAGSRYAMTVQALIVLVLIVSAARLRLNAARTKGASALHQAA